MALLFASSGHLRRDFLPGESKFGLFKGFHYISFKDLRKTFHKCVNEKVILKFSPFTLTLV